MKKIILSALAVNLVCLSSTLVFAANAKPAVGTITPASGTSDPYQAVNFTTTYTDANGWQDIQYVSLIINTSSSGAKCFYAHYNPAANQLYLRNDANTAWLGGVAPGTISILENSYVKLDCSQTKASGSGTTLTVNWKVTFKSTFTGTKYSYLYVKDNANAYAGWTKKGRWKINSNLKPQVGTIAPSSGTSYVNSPLNISATYTDANSAGDIHYAYILFNTSTSLTNCLYAYYDRNTDRLYLRDDTNKVWLGGFAPGSANVIENSYARLDCSSTTTSQQANTLTVNWALSFKYIFTGTKNVYLYVTDNARSSSGWVNKGTRTISALFYWAIVDEYDKPLPTQGYYYNYTGGDRGLMNAESQIAYQWDGNSSYSATALVNPGGFGWTWAGMWYSLIKVNNDNIPLDFKAIFGPYVKSEYQGEVTDIEIAVNKVKSPSGNSGLCFRIELKDESGNIIGTQQFTNIKSLSYPRTFTWSLPEGCKKKVKLVSWILDKAKKGDAISIDRIRLRTLVPDLSKVPSQEQVFLWTFSWLMSNYDPATGMVQDRSNFNTGDFENITATAKLAKIIYYAYKKGYVSLGDATAVITKIADTLIYRVPRGPSGINTLWPHFTRNGGTVAIPPHDNYAGTEWASGDSAYAALDIITALQLIADPQAQLGPLEDFLKQIKWSDLLSSDKVIGHGYTYEGNKIPNSWGGFGMETIGANWAYASSTGNRAKMGIPPSDNGSGFIDNVLYPVVFSGTDSWGNNWDAYRDNMANTQIGWYNVSGRNQYLANTGLFGLSAAETPESDGGYQAYGVGGKNVALNDGNSEVIVFHYAGMISDIRPTQTVRIWEFLRDRTPPILQNKIFISPLNNVESIRVGKTTGKCTANYLKGSWNMALQAEGWAMYDPAIRSDLAQAIQNNTFLKQGYQILMNAPAPGPRTLKVPAEYTTIQQAVDAAGSGDTIEISPRTYVENINITSKNKITIKGTIVDYNDPVNSGLNTVINGNGGVPVSINNSNNITVTGLVITGVNHGVFDGSNSSGLDIRNCEDVMINGNILTKNTTGYLDAALSCYNCKRAVISDNLITANSGHYAGAIKISYIVNPEYVVTIKNNKIINNYAWATGGGIETVSAYVLIYGNLIYGNSADSAGGMELLNTQGEVKNNLIVRNNSNCYSGGGVYFINSPVLFINNVVYRNFTPGAVQSKGGGIFIEGSALPVIENNIITENSSYGSAIYNSSSSILTLSYNDIYNNYPDDNFGCVLGSGSLSKLPLFVGPDNNDSNPYNDDYHLQVDSPCLNTGDPDQQFNDKDGTRNDMGIYGGPHSM